MDYFINNALCLKAKKKKKNFFLTIQYFRKSLKPVATAKRLIFYYLSEVQHESPATQQSRSFGPRQLADLTSTRGARASSHKMLSGGEKALGVVNRSLSSPLQPDKGCSSWPGGTHSPGALGTSAATQPRQPPAGRALSVWKELGSRFGRGEDVNGSRTFLPPPS